MSRYLLLSVCFVLLVILSSACFAQELKIDIDDIDFAPKLHVSVVQENPYYSEYGLFEDDYGESEDTVIRFLDSSGNVISEVFILDSVVVPYDPRISMIEILRDEEQIFSGPIDFCDDDGVCEPCFTDNCNSSESFLTCGDCPSGTYDNYCDLKRDGICDPDCYDTEGDCNGCIDCFYEDSTCESLGGVTCEPEEDCIGGKFLFSVGIEGVDPTCCYGGTCGDLAEYLNTQMTIDYYPEDYETPEEEPPVGNCEDRGGVLCDWNQECIGEWDFYVPAYDPEADDGLCCQGRCVAEQVDRIGTPAFEELRETSEAPLTEAEIKEALSDEPEYFGDPEVPLEGIEILENPNDEGLAAENYEEIDVDAGETAHEGFVEQPLDYEEEEIPEEPGVVEEAINFAEETAGDIELFHVIVIFIILLMLIVGSIGIFKAVAKKNIVAIRKPDLQDDIDVMIAQGKDYKQAEAILMQRGYQKPLVDSEIRKNYQARLARQKGQEKER